jgi:hypothetical protein
MAELRRVLEQVDPEAVAPAVEFMRLTPAPVEPRLPQLSREELGQLLPAAALTEIDRVLATDGGPPSRAREVQPIPSLPDCAPAWFSAPTLTAWSRLSRAMEAALCRPAVPASGYRSPAHQALLVIWVLSEYGYDAEQAVRRVQSPARSEHCRPAGHAVDLTTPATNADPAGRWAFAQTDEYAWLRENAGRFGFRESYADPDRPIGPEPWHWRHDA